ncbi:hypothetical protein DSO57_1007715 [Entomophthora muscae]|uniref:Uncharacterized protein n=1 Tax=Entomophthora muscae TaxID=34485 RepID=A0ACC2SWJ5_9FUNG|nr:hypothetical protein DSO57_1007715 [Entomophthora muscae]
MGFLQWLWVAGTMGTFGIDEGEEWVGKGNFSEYHKRHVMGINLLDMPFACSRDRHQICASHLNMVYEWSSPVVIHTPHKCKQERCVIYSKIIFSQGIKVETWPQLFFNQETSLMNIFSRHLGKARHVTMDHLVKRSFLGPGTRCIYYKLLGFVIQGSYHINLIHNTTSNGFFTITYPVPLGNGLPDVVYGDIPCSFIPPKQPIDFFEAYDPPEFKKT